MTNKKGSDALVRRFFCFQNELKLYHWRTYKYSRHKASDTLGTKILELMDAFFETYMGVFGRVELDEKHPLQVRLFTDKNADKLLQEMIAFLFTLDKVLRKQPALLNIRDEMLSHLQQALYLFTLE